MLTVSECRSYAKRWGFLSVLVSNVESMKAMNPDLDGRERWNLAFEGLCIESGRMVPETGGVVPVEVVEPDDGDVIDIPIEVPSDVMAGWQAEDDEDEDDVDGPADEAKFVQAYKDELGVIPFGHGLKDNKTVFPVEPLVPVMGSVGSERKRKAAENRPRKLTPREVVEWVAEKLGQKDVDRKSCPDSTAWGYYQWARRNKDIFWKDHYKIMLPSRADLSKQVNDEVSGDGQVLGTLKELEKMAAEAKAGGVDYA